MRSRPDTHTHKNNYFLSYFLEQKKTHTLTRNTCTCAATTLPVRASSFALQTLGSEPQVDGVGRHRSVRAGIEGAGLVQGGGGTGRDSTAVKHDLPAAFRGLSEGGGSAGA